MRKQKKKKREQLYIKTEAKTKCHRPTVDRDLHTLRIIITSYKGARKQLKRKMRKMKERAISNDQKLENPLSVKLKQAS